MWSRGDTHRAPPSEDSKGGKHCILGAGLHPIEDFHKEMPNPCPRTSQTSDLCAGHRLGDGKAPWANLQAQGTAACNLQGHAQSKGVGFDGKALGNDKGPAEFRLGP